MSAESPKEVPFRLGYATIVRVILEYSVPGAQQGQYKLKVAHVK